MNGSKINDPPVYMLESLQAGYLLVKHYLPAFASCVTVAIHTLDLPERNSSRDGALNEISIREERVVVTKDTDFYYSHVL